MVGIRPAIHVTNALRFEGGIIVRRSLLTEERVVDSP